MSPFRHIRVGAVLILTLLAACSDNSEPTATTQANLSTASSTEGIPTRAEEYPNGWHSVSDSALWQHIAGTDSTAIVGLRAPDAPRGIWRDKLLLSRTQWDQSHTNVISHSGVILVETDGELPAIRVKLANQGALEAVRRLVTTDYLEPAILKTVGDGWASGCSDGDGWTGSTTIAGGDLVV